jgi:hypothetical protein
VVPAAQADPGATRKLLETLAFGLVEIGRARAAFDAGGRRYLAGSHVIRMQQPFSSFAKTLLECQRYPDLRVYPGGPPRRPYDVTAHALPLLMGVAVDAVEGPFDAPLDLVFRFDPPPEKRTALPASDTDSWREVNRVWRAGGTVWRDPATGDFYSGARPGLIQLHRPRIGLYRSHVPSMDEGWTRWLLEEFGFAYERAGNADITAGALRRRFDVIVFPDQSSAEITDGFRKGEMPEEYCGGLGDSGADALRSFARDGGTLIFLNHSTAWARTRLGLDAADVLEGIPNTEYYSPGSLLNVALESKSALTLGLPERIAIWSQGSPAWRAADAAVVARYPQSDILASGWLLGEKRLSGQAALADLPFGSGRVILFGMRPQYRAQSYQAFKLLFNALLLGA